MKKKKKPNLGPRGCYEADLKISKLLSIFKRKKK
jgi:hypothetical protein